MVSNCKEAELDLHGGSVPVSLTSDPGMIALVEQADVAVIVGDSGTVSLVELTTNWEKGFSMPGSLEVDLLPQMVGRGQFSCGLAVKAKPMLFLVAESKTF